jgi:hypothetical protein
VKYRTAVAALLLAVAFFGVPEVKPRSVAVYAIPEPSSDMKATVQPIVKVVSSMNAIDRLWLQNIYLNCARVVEADGIVDEPTITSTDGLRAVHVAVLAFIWKGMADNSPEKYPRLAEAIDSALNSCVSEDSRQITPELRRRAADLYRAIAWAGLGKDA